MVVELLLREESCYRNIMQSTVSNSVVEPLHVIDPP